MKRKLKADVKSRDILHAEYLECCDRIIEIDEKIDEVLDEKSYLLNELDKFWDDQDHCDYIRELIEDVDEDFKELTHERTELINRSKQLLIF